MVGHIGALAMPIRAAPDQFDQAVPAQYRAEFVLNSASGGSARVQLGMRVGTPASGSGKVGRLYALLIDAATGLPIAQADAEAAGRYDFVFAGRLPGSYFLAAGSDLDNDGYICDAGESCGIYPSFALPEVITLGNADLVLAPFLIVADVAGVIPAGPASRADKAARHIPERGWRRR
jgi:serine protease